MGSELKPIGSPVPEAWYPALSVLLLGIGLLLTASFFMEHHFKFVPSNNGKPAKCDEPKERVGMEGKGKLVNAAFHPRKLIFDPRPSGYVDKSYETTSTRRNRSLSKELTTGAVASVFLGFGSLFLLLATGVYV